MSILIHFNDLRQQSVRLSDIILASAERDYSRDQTAINPPSTTYYSIKLTVDLPQENDFTGVKKREISLWYDVDKDARDADLKMLRMASTTFIIAKETTNPDP